MARPRGRSRQRRPEGPPLARRTSGRERATREVEPLAGEVLRLQRSGGNEAVTTMLAQRDLFDDGETEVDQTEEEAGFEQTDIEQAGPGFEEGGGSPAGPEQSDGGQTEGGQSGFEESEAEEESTGAPGAPGDATLVMDDPIGTLSLVSSSQTDAAGRQFSVRVRSSAKDALLFAASATGQPVGTVRIGGTVLQNVTIPSIATGASGTVDMTLTSGTGTPPAPVGSTLVMDDPIGALTLISSSPADRAGREFSVVVASSSKDALLFGAAASGQSVGTVKLTTKGGVVTLENVLISSISVAGQDGANLTMTLNSQPSAK